MQDLKKQVLFSGKTGALGSLPGTLWGVISLAIYFFQVAASETMIYFCFVVDTVVSRKTKHSLSAK